MHFAPSALCVSRITVNSVAPGFIDTARVRSAFGAFRTPLRGTIHPKVSSHRDVAGEVSEREDFAHPEAGSRFLEAESLGGARSLSRFLNLDDGSEQITNR